MMTVTERAAEISDLLLSFKKDGIGHDPKRGLDKVLRFQDLIGRATMSELCEVDAGFAEEQRRLFVWACFSCLGYDSAINVFRNTVGRRKITQWYEEEVKQLRADQDSVDKRSLAAELKAQEAGATMARAEQICEEADARCAREIKGTLTRLLAETSRQTREIETLRTEIETLQAELDSQSECYNRVQAENADLQAVKRVLASLVEQKPQPGTEEASAKPPPPQSRTIKETWSS